MDVLKTLRGSSLGSTLRLVAFKVIKKARLTAVKSSEIHATSKIESGTTFYFSKMAKHSFCGYDCEIFHADIGSFTSIGNGVVIGGGRHPMDWAGMSPVFYEGRDSVSTKFAEHEREPVRRTLVGHDVWIGRSAILLPGVCVADGAVVGAGSVVTKPVPPYAIVAGNPARLIRYRFGDDIVERLQTIQWWTMDEQQLFKIGPCFNDIEKFLVAVEKCVELCKT